MKKWEINCDGWYPYCPICKKEPLYRTPICMNCGTILQADDKDMQRLLKEKPEYYNEVINAYRKQVLQ